LKSSEADVVVDVVHVTATLVTIADATDPVPPDTLHVCPVGLILTVTL
jgi:hypothetical protein